MFSSVSAAGLVFILSIGAEPTSDLANPSKHLVLDERVIASSENVRLFLGTVEKASANPLFQADQVWENSLNNLYPNIVYDPNQKLYKLWYKCVLVDKEVIAKMNPPRTTHDVGWYLCYAQSKDGLKWEKPELGLIEHNGNTKNNIVARDCPNVGVFRDPHAKPDQRYKLVSDVGMGKIETRYSADGLKWSEPVSPKGLGNTGDTHNNAFWDESLGKYVMFTRYYYGERLVARSESKDFTNWETPQVVVRSTLTEGKGRQCYCMPVFRYANGYLGFLMMYNVGKDRTVDCELAWSEDSIHWRRILPGTHFIPRGAKDTYDGGCIYAQAGPPVLQDGKLHLYYGGSKETHTGWKRHCLPCLAYLRPDGFAGYEPSSDKLGTILSHPVLCDGSPLRVSADAKGGTLRVEVVGVAGYSLEDCEPINTNVTDGEIRWRGGKTLANLKGRAVQLRFSLDKSKLYAFSGPKAMPRPSVDPEPQRFKEEIKVTIATPKEFAGTLRYTLDGSEPNDKSPEYKEPFKVTKATTIKSRLFPKEVNGGGPILTAKYEPFTTWEQANPGKKKEIVAFGSQIPVHDSWGRTEIGGMGMGGGNMGFTWISASREKAPPYLYADSKTCEGNFVGNLEKRYGGTGVAVAFKYSSAVTKHPYIEFIANDLGAWSYQPNKELKDEWNEITFRVRYDWTDAEAQAAGWKKGANAVSWKETIRNVGRLAIVQPPDPKGGSFSFAKFGMGAIFD